MGREYELRSHLAVLTSGKCLLTLVAPVSHAAQGSELCSGKDEMRPISSDL